MPPRSPRFALDTGEVGGFSVGVQEIPRFATHAPPSRGRRRPLHALTGDRNAVHCSDEFARRCGFERAPVHDMLVFHMVFGRTVGEISLNSPGNLGYADVRFERPVFPGDTLRAETETLGWRETSKGDTGVVWVTQGSTSATSVCSTSTAG
jgi:2-methylfumaryl-CoA hydratase